MNTRAKPKKRFSLKIQLSAALVGLLVVLGASLGWFYHQKTTEIVLTSSKELFDRVASDVSNAFYSSYNPVSTTVRLLSDSPLMQDDNLEKRLTRLPTLVSVLNAQPELAALSVGYADSEYFIVRVMNSSYMKKRFGAPDNAAFAVDNIEREEGQPVFTRLFYDEKLTLMGSKDMGYTSYNPIKRPWYRLAIYSGDVTTTSPYLYYFIGKVGVTLVKQAKDAGSVIAADITLESISDTLISNQVSPSSKMLVYTGDGKVFASLEPDTIVRQAGPDGLEILKLSDLEGTVVRDFFRNLTSEGSQSFTDAKGNLWIGVNRPINLVGFTANLLILAPEHELLAVAYDIRNQSVLIIALLTLAAIPLVLYLAGRLGRPLQNLAATAAPIRHLDFREQEPLLTKTREAQILSESLNLSGALVRAFCRGIQRIPQSPDRSSENIHDILSQCLPITQANGALLYHLEQQQNLLIPCALVTDSGKVPLYSLSRLDLADSSLAFVQVVQGRESKILDIGDVVSPLTGTYESLLNHIGSETLKGLMIPLIRPGQVRADGLLCLFYKPEHWQKLNIENPEGNPQIMAAAKLCSLTLTAYADAREPRIVLSSH